MIDVEGVIGIGIRLRVLGTQIGVSFLLILVPFLDFRATEIITVQLFAREIGTQIGVGPTHADGVTLMVCEYSRGPTLTRARVGVSGSACLQPSPGSKPSMIPSNRSCVHFADTPPEIANGPK